MQLLAKRLSLGYAVGLYVYIGVLSVVSASNRNDHPERGVKLIFRYPDVRARPALSESVLGESRDNATTKRVYGVIECYDCETLEAIRRLLNLPGEARRNVALLLLNGFHSSFLEYCKAIHSPLRIVVPVRLNKESSLRRSCRLPDLTWSRRIWSLAAKASLIAFTGVYYSVLGGAYSSLSKANVSYAYKAGLLATRQIRLAQWLQDPILELKCWLYYAEDLIQLKHLRRARKIVTYQKKIAEQLQDEILLTMCASVEAKLANAGSHKPFVTEARSFDSRTLIKA